MAEPGRYLEFTADIVASYVSNNTVSVNDIANLIKIVSSTLDNIERVEAPSEKPVDLPSPSEIRKSIKPEGLISFVDGKSYKTLKRHLAKNNMTLAEYKKRYGLPADYPSTAPDYSARRSALAKELGLGRKAAEPAPAAAKPGRKPAAPVQG